MGSGTVRGPARRKTGLLAGYFAWQAELLSQNADMLFGLFEQGRERTWKAEFLGFFEAQLKG